MAKRILPLLPPGLLVQQVQPGLDRVLILTASEARTACCPLCGTPSACVHSRYTRTLADLPWQGRTVAVRVAARRFRCQMAACPRRIFAERLPEITAGAWSRRTARLGNLQRQIGLALGGEAGARLAQQLAMPASGDTLLRLLRRTEAAPRPAARIVGIDDFAWRKGNRYGTILVDLERHAVIDLLPDRDADTAARWLEKRPDIAVVSRDRGAVYADAARRGAPQAVAVADRWHLLANLGQAVQTILDRHKPTLRTAAQKISSDTATIARVTETAGDTPPPMTSAERRQWTGWERRRATWKEVVRLGAKGLSARAISRRLGLARETVRKFLHGGEPEVHRPRHSSLAPHLAFLERRWGEGCHNGAQLWRELRAAGFDGGLRVVTEWATRRRLTARPERLASPIAAPSTRRVAMLLTADPSSWTAERSRYLERVFALAPNLATVQELARRFGAMVRQRQADALSVWLDDADTSDLRSFADGLRSDFAAVHAALTTPWSNGQTEGQITRLKLVKRSMYGRAKPDLLRIRLMAV
ncbi:MULTISPECIES: ISL3 family transposase [unclassified Azospirillum]|uniref:ISL3 family transposase n=1 Tax=unclassified Azospirillum TaxID=2630922 RepID=UPI001FFE56A9|nr:MULTISPECIES: ISL3 family transposase [unclassified Azospirillum]